MGSTVRNKKFLTYLFCILVAVSAIAFGKIKVSADYSYAQKTVRVGYVVSGNFQSGEEGERKSGYGYEYLQEISYYTGWKYEYVYGSFSESLERLKNGEVDLMSNVSYTPERAEYISYSENEQGEEYFYIYGYEGICDIDADSMASFNGKKIGITAGSYQIELLKNWCNDNNVECEIIEYNNLDDRVSDFENGVIDATVATGGYPGENWFPLVEIGKSPYYYGVNKNRPDILDELNEAMTAIKISNPYYNEQLGAKYLTSSSAVIKSLTDSEQEWLSERESIVVGYLKGYMPYCGTDNAGEADGLLKDILDNFTGEYGIEFTTMEFSSYTEMRDALHEGKVDTIFPTYCDYGLAENSNEMVTDAVITSSMMVFNSGEEIKGIERIAVSYADPFQEQYVSIFYPDAEIVECNSLSECVEAVLKKKADFTIVESAKVNETENVIRNKKIQRVDLPDNINLGFAVNQGNIQLLSILNKCILYTDDSLIINSLIFHSQQNVNYTVIDFFREHIVSSFIGILVIFGVIIGILTMHYMSVIKSKKEISEAYHQIRTAKWEAKHDPLTGLYNRAAFQEICVNLKDYKSPIVLLIIDVDNFKKINDSHGHKVGDKALVKVANQLLVSFRPEDYVFRYAGDEFAIIMMNVRQIDASMISERVNNINEELKNVSNGAPSLSISVGAAFSETGYSEELFNLADKAMYSVKDSGRGGYAFSETS